MLFWQLGLIATSGTLKPLNYNIARVDDFRSTRSLHDVNSVTLTIALSTGPAEAVLLNESTPFVLKCKLSGNPDKLKATDY